MSRFAAHLVATFLVAALSSVLLADDTAVRETSPAPTDSDWEARIEKALASNFSFKGVEVSLADFADQVSEKTGITVLLDRRSLDDVGIRDDVPVTRDLKGISLRSVLRLVLSELDLTYDLCDGALMITTRGDTYSHLHTLFYDVTDLASAEPPAGSGRFAYDEITKVITSTVAPTCWDTVGGPGAIAACRGHLVVSQTRDVHEAIRNMLSMIRKAKRLSRARGTPSPTVVCVDEFEDDPVVRRIWQALHQPISVDFQRDSLEHVASKLREMLDINVELDVLALDDVGIGTNVPITFRAQDMRLDFVLIHILRELDLTYVIRNQVLLITTPGEYERELATRLYPVGDILGPIRGRDLFGDPVRPVGIDELIQSITATVTPHNWDSVGGPASVTRFADEDFLIVTQSDRAHKDIVQTLTRLRASLANATAKADPDAETVATDGPTRLVVYFVQVSFAEQTKSPYADAEEPTSQGGMKLPLTHDQAAAGAGIVTSQHDTQELLDLVVDLIESTSGDARDDAYARALPGRLVICHTDHVHRQIKKLLKKLRVQKEDAQPQPWTGGGGFF